MSATTSLPAMLTEHEVAQHLRLSVKTLQDWRVNGIGPQFVKFGRAVRYTADAVDEYVRASVVARASKRHRR